MGAYLHLRDVHNSEGNSESNPDTENYNRLVGHSCPQLALEFGSSSSEESSSTCAIYERLRNNNDCANFWAGRLDDVFEEHQSSTKHVAVPTEKVKLRVTPGAENFANGESTTREFDSTINARDHSISGLSTNWSTDCEEAANLVEEEGCCSAAIDVANSSRSDGLAKCLPGKMTGRAADELEPVHYAKNFLCKALVDESDKLPDHLLIELLVRVPTRDWPAAACVKKRWAQLFKGDGLWQSALVRKWPDATAVRRWPGPIARGSSKRRMENEPPAFSLLDCWKLTKLLDGGLDLHPPPAVDGFVVDSWRYTALHVSDSLFAQDKVHGVSEVAGHVYLFLKEQLESCPPVSYGLLHGTIIDQFLACRKTGDEAHELATHIWIAVLDNLDESENTFHLLMRIAEEWEIFLPYPYSKSRAVQWRLFERLFTDFRDCLSRYNYFDILTRARSKFELIPQTWLGY